MKKLPRPPPLKRALERQKAEKKQLENRPFCEKSGMHSVNITTHICEFCGKKIET
jgi:hypothetical protein